MRLVSLPRSNWWRLILYGDLFSVLLTSSIVKADTPSKLIVFKKQPDTHIVDQYGFHSQSLIDMHYAVGQFSDDTISKLKDLDLIDWTEDNKPVKINMGPPAIQYNIDNWGLDRIDQHTLPLDGAYNYPASGGEGALVFIMDTGINVKHQEFENRAFHGAVLGGSAEKRPDDEQGHGTFVAGVIGGANYGVAKQVTLISVKILNKYGVGTTSDVIEGLAWVLEQHLASDKKMSIIK
jgi:subtilisin family serine protease